MDQLRQQGLQSQQLLAQNQQLLVQSQQLLGIGTMSSVQLDDALFFPCCFVLLPLFSSCSKNILIANSSCYPPVTTS